MERGEFCVDCPVCGKKSESLLCPECGFDSSRDYESYPTLGPVRKIPAVSALRKKWQRREIAAEPEKKPQKKRSWIGVAACALTLVLGIAIGAGFGGGNNVPDEELLMQTPPERTDQTAQITYLPGEEPWRENVLRSDAISPNEDDPYLRVEVVQYPVFGSEYRRKQISSITFLDTLKHAPKRAWDVSEAGDGRVLAWVVPNGELYDLYIGAEGGISAGKSCHSLFAGYSNAEQIRNMAFFHTENVQNMAGMFSHCYFLTSLDLSSFDTANVQDMRGMFAGCMYLTSLDLSSFDTANVQDMGYMFQNCISLTSLDLSCFDTSNVRDMIWMFGYCSSLAELDLSSFDTSKADTYHMFYNCPAGDDWQHLLK